MFRSLRIRNFQSHKDTHLQFVPGVNVVIGPSDSGKSAIVRALSWLKDNRPQGTPFISWWADNKESTCVELVLDDSPTIIRERTRDGAGSYKCGDQEEYRALNAETPDEIKSRLRLDWYNVQSQHEGYFLIQDSPGAVATKLNDVVGLNDVDTFTRQINTLVTSTKSRLHDREESIARVDEELGELSGVDELYVEMMKLERLLGERDERRKQIKELGALVREVNIISHDIRVIDRWLQIGDDIDRLFVQARELQDDVLSLDSLRDAVKAVKKIEDELGAYDAVMQLESEILGLREEAKTLRGEKKELQEISNIVAILVELDGEIGDSDTFIQNASRRRTELLKEVDFCPVCMGEIDGDVMLENVLNYFS